jgi:serine/threonine protein kinase
MGWGIGDTVDRYRIEAVLSRAERVEVYKGRHLWLDGAHALKRVSFDAGPSRWDSLMAAGRAMALLQHPNLVRATDAFSADGLPVLVMDFVDGPTLADFLADHDDPLPLPIALRLFDGILAGVGHAHRAGWIHRDLKPENILLDRTPAGLVPKVTDFAHAAGFEGPAPALGTPGYQSPEQQQEGVEIDERSDLWALGCILYELLTLRLAFDGEDDAETAADVAAGRYDDPRLHRPELPEPLRRLVAELLAVDPARRPASCEAVRERLAAIP